ncbi:MAG: hypothetical protein M3347_11310 [Armatimonadota bacterium]|nr:hypothetical protein [Armatimonadota bacterium]
MKKGCIAALVVLALLISPFFIHPLLNNRRLRQVENSFAQLKHPAQSTLVRRVSDVGLLIGNSNHCDFFVGELRSYTGTQQQILNFYKRSQTWHSLPDTGQAGKHIVFVSQGVIPKSAHLPYGYQKSEDWSITSQMKRQQLYLVYFLDVGVMNAGCDLRCT